MNIKLIKSERDYNAAMARLEIIFDSIDSGILIFQINYQYKANFSGEHWGEKTANKSNRYEYKILKDILK